MSPEKTDQSTVNWTHMTVGLILLILLLGGGLLGVLSGYNQRTLDTELQARGRLLAENLLAAMDWNVTHRGILVKKKPGMPTSQFLQYPDIVDTNGKVYTKKSHALMFQEIAEIAGRRKDLDFHLTSLTPLNPTNQANGFDRQGLKALLAGKKYFSQKILTGQTRRFHYLVPLIAKESCRACHQGSKPGSLLGGLSLSFGFDQAAKAHQATLFLVASLFVLTLAIFALISSRALKKIKTQQKSLARQLQRALALGDQLEITDKLTGLHNLSFALGQLKKEFRRAVRYHRPLTCMLFRPDSFEKIRGTYGQAAGDEILKTLGSTISGVQRNTDTMARYLDEKFLLILPETDSENAACAAERLQDTIRKIEVEVADGSRIGLLANFGVSGTTPTYEDYEKGIVTMETLLKNAEKALDQVKEGSGNHIVIINPNQTERSNDRENSAS